MRSLAIRLARTAATIFGLVLVTFVLLRLAPGDPAELRFADPTQAPGPSALEAVARFREAHLLDRSLPVQFLQYLGPFDLSPRGHECFGGTGEHRWNGLLALDLGHEYLRPSVSIGSELARRLAVTLPLALVSALLAFALAVPLGIAQALRRGSAFDLLASLVTLTLYSTPVFWGALLLLALFGPAGLGWFPVMGSQAFETFGGAVRHSVLPVVCMSYGALAWISRQMRSAVLETVQQDYVLAARARGLPERAVVLRHIVRNSLLPTLTLVGQVLPWLVGGSLVVETVFEIPGMGKYAFDSLERREYDAVAACVLVSGLMTLAGLALSDFLYARFDPRLRHVER
ncbi:MAG: ABC transporter permease [Planctomycetaceae bacterium]|nr:ABC transporter permease [Planctomycetaceae bacterium]